jgi:hypothetical protein
MWPTWNARFWLAIILWLAKMHAAILAIEFTILFVLFSTATLEREYHFLIFAACSINYDLNFLAVFPLLFSPWGGSGGLGDSSRDHTQPELFVNFP